jgi:hypothetical protein
MRIYIGFEIRVHNETKAMVADNFELLALKLNTLGFETETALRIFRQGRAILGSISNGMVRTTEGTEYYDKALHSHDSPLIGYCFSNDYRSVLSIKTVLNHFHELVIDHNPNLLTLLYRKEKALMDTVRMKSSEKRIKENLEEKLMTIEDGVLKHYAPIHRVQHNGYSHVRWNLPHKNPLFIPEGVIAIGGHTIPKDDQRFANDLFYHPFMFNLDVDHLAMHDTVEEIGDKAFEYCINLKTVVVSKNLKRIGVNAFLGCKELNYLDLYPSLESIGEGAFHGCVNLKKVYFHGSKKDLEKLKSILSQKFDKKVVFQTNDELVQEI